MAPPVLSFEDLGLVQGEGWLFRHLDIHIGPRDRLALIGRNGAGKTTLFKLIADLIEADKGKRSIQPGTRIVVLEQDPFFTGYAVEIGHLIDAKSTLQLRDGVPRNR